MSPVRQWRSLAEAERDPAFLERAAREFPSLADAFAHPIDRRRALRLMAASLAMAGLGGCDPASEDGQLVPAVVAPPDIVPGIANHYATVSLAGGSAIGITVTHQMGRPIKVEGNPHHPASLGATDIFAQAALLDFYDPDRNIGLTQNGIPSDRPTLLTALAAKRAEWAQNRGEGLRFLTGTVLSPTLARQIAGLLAQYPAAQWHQWDAISRDSSRRAARLAYGKPIDVVPRVEQASVLVGFESDLISSAPGHLAHARGFAARRNPTRTQAMSRIYAIEPTPTLLGTVADHRIVAGPADMARLLGAIAAGVLDGARSEPRVNAIVDDLKANQGQALVHAGPDLPAEAQALVLAVNETLEGRGKTFDVIDSVEPSPVDQLQSLRALVTDMQAGRVTSLIVLGTNPVFTAPADVEFAQAMSRVPFRLVLASSFDETTAAATWFVPATHAWETWSDARAFDGTASIIQPQSLPLYGGFSPHTMLAWLAGPQERHAIDLARETWGLDQAAWHAALATGVLPGTAHQPIDVPLDTQAHALRAPASPSGLAVLCRPDPNLLDGRHANNPWLQELPRPLTKITWDNPLLIPPELARRENLQNGDEVRLSVGARAVTAPVFMVPGQAPDTIVALFGYGRSVVGQVGGGTGFNMFPLFGAQGAVRLEKTAKRHRIATTDHHDVLAPGAGPDGIARHVTLSQFQAGLHHEDPYAAPSLYPPRKMAKQAWAMSVDLNSCIGCNACAVACQAENNVPTVGRDQVSAGARDVLAPDRQVL